MFLFKYFLVKCIYLVNITIYLIIEPQLYICSDYGEYIVNLLKLSLFDVYFSFVKNKV